MAERTNHRQLTLLPSSDPAGRRLAASNAPLRFRLDADTRRRGLQHVAELRRQLDAQRAARAAHPTGRTGRTDRDDRSTAA